MSNKIFTLNIEGMSCMSCVNQVKIAMAQVQSVKEVNIDLAAKKANVQVDDDSIKREDLIKALNENTAFTAS